MTVDEIRASLLRSAEENFGAERAEALRPRLTLAAGWMARLSAEPISLEDAAPDLSGFEAQETR